MMGAIIIIIGMSFLKRYSICTGKTLHFEKLSDVVGPNFAGFNSYTLAYEWFNNISSVVIIP